MSGPEIWSSLGKGALHRLSVTDSAHGEAAVDVMRIGSGFGRGTRLIAGWRRRGAGPYGGITRCH